MDSVITVLKLAELSLKRNALRVLSENLKVPFESNLSFSELVVQENLSTDAFRRFLNFCSYSELIQWVSDDVFVARRLSLGDEAEEILRALASSESSMGLSVGAIALALELRILMPDLKMNPEFKSVLDTASSNCMLFWIRNFTQVSLQLFQPKCIFHAIKTAKTQWSNAFNIDVKTPFDLKKFDRAVYENLMKAMHQANVREAEQLCSKIDLTSARHVLDLGGASGAIGSALCARFPNIEKYFIYELESAIPIYRKIAGYDLNSKIVYKAGDFFVETGKGLIGLMDVVDFDFIVLGWILHDWDDASSISILRKLKHHLRPTGTLCLLEAVLPDDRLGPATLLDLTMLVQTGGRERTFEEYQTLASAAGFKIYDVLNTSGRRQILLGSPR